MTAARRLVLAVDYGGVLTNPMAESFDDFRRATGVPVADLRDALVSAAEQGDSTVMAALERGELSVDDAFARVVGQLPGAYRDHLGSPAEMSRLWLAGRTPNRAMIQTLKRVRSEHGVPLALASNNVREWEMHWRTTIGDLTLDHEVVSCAIGARKPESRFYEHLVEVTDSRPEDVFFVDDVEENVAAARSAGMTAVPFSSVARFVTDLDAWLRTRAGGHREAV